MKPGPLRQAVGVIGLLALVPTAILLAGGALGSREAALRAVVTLLGVVLVGRLVGAWLHAAASGLEAAAAGQVAAPVDPRQEAPADPRREATADPRQEATAGPAPRRRASDGSGDARSSAEGA